MMESIMKRFLILSFLLIISATISRADWPLFHGDLERTGFSSISTTAGLVELWQADLGSPVYISPVVADGKVYVSTADARLFAFDAFTGVQLWQATPGSWLEASPTVFEGRLYLPCVDHFVYCYDAGDGSLLWEVETGSWVESSPLAFDGKVYVGGSDHQFYAFDALDGSLLFSIESEFDVITAPSTDGQNIFYAGDDEQIHAVTPDGAPLWTASAGGAVYGAPVVAEGKIIYASVANGSGLSLNRLAALSIATGAEIWSRNFEEYEFLYGTPAVAYGNVYIGDFQGSVYACNLDD